MTTPEDQTPDPIGYAVVEERDGAYAAPRAGDTFLIGDPEPVTRRRLTADDARFYAGARATSHEDTAGYPAGVGWHIVALVPVAPATLGELFASDVHGLTDPPV